MENDFEQILEPGPDCCIYRVPQFLRKINEEAYTPLLISIGPLHYGRKELMGMENHKRRYWSKFGQRKGVNAEKLNEFKTYIEEQEQRIRDHYSVTSMLQSSEYVSMVLYDAVFIIEFLLRNYEKTDDFLLKSPLCVYIKRDLILLENQLPFFVLNHLYTKAFQVSKEQKALPIPQSLFVLFLKYFHGSNPVCFLDEHFFPKHFTDFHRFIFLENKPPTVELGEVETYNLPCATKLDKLGLKFKGINSKFWLDIRFGKRKRYGKWFPWFKVNELQISTIVIDDNTECFLRNLIAFEMFHYPTETHICRYAAMMNQLINTKKDVDLLVEEGVIINHMDDNEAVAKFFNRLVSYVVLSKDSCYNDIAKKMKARYGYPWNHAKAPKGTATVAAISLPMQSVCTDMQVV